MAVAGLHNVSVINSSVSRESHQSPLSRWRGGRDRPSTRASSLLQMWRELEGEHFTDHPQVRNGERSVQGRADGVNTEFGSTYLSGERGHDNVDSLVDTNEVENECTISHQGLQNEHDDNTSLSSESNDSHLNSCSRSQWLVEKECERVRIVRDWVEKTTQQRGTCHDGIEEQDAEIGSQIERVREGLVDNCQTGARRTIRRLCGRQALLDLLMRAERERKRELQDLLEHRPVSDFPHRNRIQSLLKGRFLRNKRFIVEERPSIAASELGLLRQRHTVSGLREGFLFESDNFLRSPLGSFHSDTSSNDDTSRHENEQTKANSLQEVVLNECCDHPELTNEETNIRMSYTEDSQTDLAEGLNMQEPVSQVEERHEVLEYEDREQQSSTIEFTERRDDVGEDAPRNSDDRLQETSGVEGSGQGTQDSSRVERDVRSASGDNDQLEGITVEHFNMPVQLRDWQESVTETSNIVWAQLGNDDYTESRASIGEGIDTNSHDSSRQQYRVTSDNNAGQHSHSQQSHEEWHENPLIWATDNWSDETSSQEVAPAERVDTSYLSGDDNGHSLEIRELLSRRRVSNLLRSDFRESLNHLIQSYVERQGHASVNWELDNTAPSPAIVEQYEEQQSGDLHEAESDDVGSTPVVLPSPQFTHSQTTWDQEFYETNWQQPNSLHRFGIEWEIINDLRIDMARLHQRMKCMQTMLEACMDMQLELQRAVGQEVSAALNRPSGSEEACEDSFQQDESKWDHVRKGICCVCCDTSIDSLLYRCGHMCTCSKCADKLVQGRGECPMCRAPVVQAVRVYSIH